MTTSDLTTAVAHLAQVVAVIEAEILPNPDATELAHATVASLRWLADVLDGAVVEAARLPRRGVFAGPRFGGHRHTRIVTLWREA